MYIYIEREKEGGGGCLAFCGWRGLQIWLCARWPLSLKNELQTFLETGKCYTVIVALIIGDKRQKVDKRERAGQQKSSPFECEKKAERWEMREKVGWCLLPAATCYICLMRKCCTSHGPSHGKELSLHGRLLFVSPHFFSCAFFFSYFLFYCHPTKRGEESATGRTADAKQRNLNEVAWWKRDVTWSNYVVLLFVSIGRRRLLSSFTWAELKVPTAQPQDAPFMDDDNSERKGNLTNTQCNEKPSFPSQQPGANKIIKKTTDSLRLRSVVPVVFFVWRPFMAFTNIFIPTSATLVPVAVFSLFSRYHHIMQISLGAISVPLPSRTNGS